MPSELTKPRFSIVIPAYNEEKGLAGTLRSIRTAVDLVLPDGWAYEFIVCNNHSTDHTAGIAARNGARVIHEAVQQISRARNTGAGIAQGQWLLFIDADTYPGPELMREVISVMENNALIGCGATVQIVGGSLFNKLRMERMNPFFRLFGFCGGAFLLCQREAFQAIGGFSDKLFAYEELDFVRRLRKYGRRGGREFVILHKHPVFTSGRKADQRCLSIFNLLLAGFAAPLLFLLSNLLPGRIRIWARDNLLKYWYRPGR